MVSPLWNEFEDVSSDEQSAHFFRWIERFRHAVSSVPLRFYEKRPTEIDRWEVVDYETKKWIDAKKAHWLIGSDIPGVMTAVSKLAFLSVEDAQEISEKAWRDDWHF